MLLNFNVLNTYRLFLTALFFRNIFSKFCFLRSTGVEFHDRLQHCKLFNSFSSSSPSWYSSRQQKPCRSIILHLFIFFHQPFVCFLPAKISLSPYILLKVVFLKTCRTVSSFWFILNVSHSYVSYHWFCKFFFPHFFEIFFQH